MEEDKAGGIAHEPENRNMAKQLGPRSQMKSLMKIREAAERYCVCLIADHTLYGSHKYLNPSCSIPDREYHCQAFR